jgi:hypothetical protein
VLFANQTPFAGKFVGIRLPDREDAIGMVLIKATYDLDGDGRSWSVAADPFPLTTETIETPHGVFHGDVHPPHDGVDLAILGTVRRSRPVREAVLTLRVAALVSQLRVLGDRTWRRAGARLAPSAPEFFTEMPLSYARAYGGQADQDGGDVPWPDNPKGVGYYLSEEQALGRPLPNVQPFDHPPPADWREPIPVVGWAPYPNTWGLRLREAYEMEGGRLKRISRRLFNNAHPDLILPAVGPGETISIEGLFDRPFVCRLPNDRVTVRTMIGDEEIGPRVRIDGIYLWTDQRKLVVTHRAVFSYSVRRNEHRTTVVTR